VDPVASKDDTVVIARGHSQVHVSYRGHQRGSSRDHRTATLPSRRPHCDPKVLVWSSYSERWWWPSYSDREMMGRYGRCFYSLSACLSVGRKVVRLWMCVYVVDKFDHSERG
jgi:hypothetical protein